MEENPYKAPVEPSEEGAPLRVPNAEVSVWRYAPASAFAAFLVSIKPPVMSWPTRIALVTASIAVAGAYGCAKRALDRRRLTQEDYEAQWRQPPS